jgi:hypothetical protein
MHVVLDVEKPGIGNIKRPKLGGGQAYDRSADSLQIQTSYIILGIR